MNTARENEMTRVEIDRALSMIRAGDQNGWDNLLLPLRVDMRALLRRRGCEDGLAEDLIQDALEVVWLRLGTLKNPHLVGSWAMSIVLNSFRTHNRRVVCVETIDETLLLHDLGPEQCTLRREARVWLRSRLGGLRPMPRRAIMLRIEDGVAPMDASRHLGVSRGRLRQILYSGLEELRRCAATAEGRAVGRVLRAVG